VASKKRWLDVGPIWPGRGMASITITREMLANRRPGALRAFHSRHR